MTLMQPAWPIKVKVFKYSLTCEFSRALYRATGNMFACVSQGNRGKIHVFFLAHVIRISPNLPGYC